MAAVLKKRALAEYTQIQEKPKLSFKNIRLTKKPYFVSPAISFINLLEQCKNSKDTLQTLLRISDYLEFEPSVIPAVLKKLSDHYKNESESAVRVKILSLFADIGYEPGADIPLIVEETITLLKNETSHKVVSRGLSTLLKLGLLVSDNAALHVKLIDVAKHNLKDVSNSVKCRSLEIIGLLLPHIPESESVVSSVEHYFQSEDARVRSEAFNTMICFYDRGFKLNPDMYSDVCAALKDDYEIVRQAALKLVWLLGTNYPENIITLPGTEERIRLVDDAFGKVCNAVNDLSKNVRQLAAQRLGGMTMVSSKFLHQTLDKKLMSDMRKKRSAHELAWENLTSGEWASGKKWADDAPRELVDADSVNLMSSGSCGAFVHGLEDEFLEVRTATVESLCQLSMNDPQFANTSLDFLVDMFNDEIEEVRLQAIDSLRKISKHIVLREDQLETILGALEDYSCDIREGLHRMLAACRLSTTTCLEMCVEKLLENLKKYPQDKKSTYKCLQKIGSFHPELTLALVPQLLGIHPIFDTPEIDVDSPSYICILILVFNAAQSSPSMLSLFKQHTLRHYSYLRDTMPQLVPELRLPGTRSIATRTALPTQSKQFMETIVNNLDIPNGTKLVRVSMLQTAQKHLTRLAEMDVAVAGAAQFTALYIGAQLLMIQILDHELWVNPTPLVSQHTQALRNNIQQLLQTCLKLEHLFVGMSDVEICAVKQFRLKALAIHLVFVVRDSNASALAPCHHFLTAVEEIERALRARELEPDTFTSAVFRELGALDEPKPGPVARCLLPLLQVAHIGRPPNPNTNIQMSKAIILEPVGETDTALKFTAGLMMAVPLEAELTNLADPSRLRIKIKYPDQKTRITVPSVCDLKPLDLDSEVIQFFDTDHHNKGLNLKMMTTVLISHQVWTEACYIDISIALAVPEADVARRKAQTDSSTCLLSLCKPVKVCVAPKPIKKGII